MINSNLLNIALSAIGSQTLTYKRYLGKTTNDIGQTIPSFADDVEIKGSFQPVPKEIYSQNGLDFKKTYFYFYASNLFNTIERDNSMDRLVYNNFEFQVLEPNDWFSYNGWQGVLCVRL